MGDNDQTERLTGRKRKVIYYLLLTLVAIVAVFYLSLKSYLASPYPAPQLSRFLTSYLHQEVRVSRVRSSGATVYLEGVQLANPPGFPKGNLVSLDALALAPDLPALIGGRHALRLLVLRGATVELTQNGRGEWNFSPLQRRFSGKKPSTSETSIGHLAIADGSIRVNGRGVEGISLDIYNLTSKGSRDSSFSLSFEDPWHSRYSLKGSARPGASPAFDVSLSASPLSFEGVKALANVKKGGAVSGGTGKLALSAGYHHDLFSLNGSLDFAELRMVAGGRPVNLGGTVTVAGSYDAAKDSATIETLILRLPRLTTLRGSAAIAKVRGARAFTALLSMDELDLQKLAFLLPEKERSETELAGRVSCRSFRVAGTGAGLSKVTGALLLKEARLKRQGRTLVSGLDVAAEVAGTKGGIAVKGHAGERTTEADVLLQGVDAPFSATLSPKLKPLLAEVLLRSARVSGIDLSGVLSFAAAQHDPFRVNLRVPAAKASALNPLLARYKVKLDSGSADLSLTGSGRSARDLAGTLKAQIAQLHGVSGEKSLTLNKGAVESRVMVKGGRISAAGALQLVGIASGKDQGDASFSYRLADQVLTLQKGALRLGSSGATFATLSGRLPDSGNAGIPLIIDLSGCAIRHGDVEVKGVSGSLRGRYFTARQGMGAEGVLTLVSDSFSWRGKGVGAPTLRVSFTRSGGRAEVGGSLFGGAAKGEVSYQPAVPERGTFSAAVGAAQLQALSSFLPAKTSVVPSKGGLDLRADGTYARRDGLSCRFQVDGKEIDIADKKGKALVTRGGVSVAGAVAGEEITITAAEVSAGSSLRLRGKGAVQHFRSPNRTGGFTFAVAATPIGEAMDPFINVLPRLLQEATTAGTVAAQGRLDLHDGKELLEGAIILEGGRFEVTGQKFLLADITGKIPVSLDLAGGDTGSTRPGLSVSKDTFPTLLKQLQKGVAEGPSLTIGRVSYGTLDLGSLVMQLAAEKGVTEIRSLRTTLYDGTVLGKGSVSMQKGGTFRVDLLASGVSLKKLCNALPNIKGYISGRLDGFLSVSGVGSGLNGLTGYTDFWAREGEGEKMVVSKEFLQRLSNRKLSGFFFSSDRPYDRAEIRALLLKGDLTFEELNIQHTNLLGVRDLSVSIAPTQNMIALDHLLASIKQAATRGKAAAGAPPAAGAPAEAAPTVQPEFKWEE